MRTSVNSGRILRYLIAATISLFFFSDIFSQIVVNEILFSNDSTIILELFNKSADTININSVSLRSEAAEVSQQPDGLPLMPFELSLVKLDIDLNNSEINNILITVNSDHGQSSTVYAGCILMGESAGRHPDIDGDFIIYNNSLITPGKSNNSIGMLVKKTSRTRFTPRDSSPNAALYYNNNYWIFGGWDYNEGDDTWSSKTNVWKSEDGIEWEMVYDNPPFIHYSSFLVFDNKMMVFSWDSVFITQDGVSWDKHALNPGFCSQARYTVFKDKAYVFSYNMIGESTDGINWAYSYTNINTDPTRFRPAFFATEDRFWLYGGEGGFNDVWTSLDGHYWTKVLDHAPWENRHWFNYTYFDNKIWMICGNLDVNNDTENFGNLQDFWYSSDGINWNKLEIDSTFQYRHGSFLWNDGKRVLISSGFGNNYRSRMYNDVWELSLKNLYLTENEYNNKKGLSIFADRQSKYSPAAADSSRIFLFSSMKEFSKADTVWTNKRISVGNGIDETVVTFNESVKINLDKWEVKSHGALQFSGLSLLNKNPEWEDGSSLLIKDLLLTNESFGISLPYNLSVENSSIQISAGSTALSSSFSDSRVTGDPSDPTIFKTARMTWTNSSANDNFWLTNIEDERLFIYDKAGYLPNIIISDPNIHLKSTLSHVRKIEFTDNIILDEKLRINSDAQILLSGKNLFTEMIFENFATLPENFELDQRSVFEVNREINLPQVNLKNNGLLKIGSNEVILKSYSEAKGIISFKEHGALICGLSTSASRSDLRLTIINDLKTELSKSDFLKVNIDPQLQNYNSNVSFRISAKVTSEISVDNENSSHPEVSELTIDIEKFNDSSNSWFSVNMGITDDKNIPSFYYNYIINNINGKIYDIELHPKADSETAFSKSSQFSSKEGFTFYRSEGGLKNGLIYPNPSKGILKIENDIVVGSFSMKIFDNSGKLIFNDTFYSDQIYFEQNLQTVFKSNGIYSVVIMNNGSGKTLNQKLIFAR